MGHRSRQFCIFVLGMIAMMPTVCGEVIEVRQYHLGESGDEAAVDAYLSDALFPALTRLEVGPLGALAPHASDETGTRSIFVFIPYRDANQIDEVRQALQADEQYQRDGRAYLSLGPQERPYERIRSELLVGMDCWPKTMVPDEAAQMADRVFELRLYESPNERLGDLKVDMFNNGEVPIFLDCGITPIFIGQAIIGPLMPSLTYLTVYPSDNARVEAWEAFRQHPDWQKLKVVPKYAGTVNRIDKFVLQAKPYSQM